MFSYAKYETIRNKQGKTNQDISFDARVASATLSCWKQGKYIPKIDKLERIAEALGVTTDEFKETA